MFAQYMHTYDSHVINIRYTVMLNLLKELCPETCHTGNFVNVQASWYSYTTQIVRGNHLTGFSEQWDNDTHKI